MSLKDLVFSPPDFAASAFAGGPEFRNANGGGGSPPGPQGNGQGGPTPPQTPNFKTRGEELIWLRSQKLNLVNEARAIGDRLKAEKRALTPEEDQRVGAIETQMQDLVTRVAACESAIQGDAADDMGSNSLPKNGKQTRSYDDFLAGLEKSFVGHNPAQQRSANGGNGQGGYQQPPPQNTQFQGGTNHRASQPIPAGAASVNYMHSYGNKTELELRRNAMQGWAGAYSTRFERDRRRLHDEAAEVLGIDLRGKTFEIPITQEHFDAYRQRENRVMTVASSTLGSKLVPTTLIDKVVERLVAIAPIRTIADQFTTETGQDMPFPTIDDSSNKGRMRSSETVAGTKTDVTIGQKTYGCYEFASDIVLVSNRLIRDSVTSLENRLGQLLPRRIARQQADKFTTGSGSGEPEGVVTSATAGATALAQAALARRDLIKLQNSLDQEYQANASWQFPLCVLEALQLLETTTGEPLFHKISEGNPPLLLGKPWMLNQSMVSALATGVVPVLYGDFRLGYSIRDVGSLVLSRSEEYAWDSEQVAFKAILSSDGRVVDPYAIMKLTMA